MRTLECLCSRPPNGCATMPHILYLWMTHSVCAHMLPVKRCPLFACSGHFRVIVTHSDTLKEMDCSGPGGPRRDHPLRHSRGHYLFTPSKTFKRCRQKLRWRQMLRLFLFFFFFHFHRINPRVGRRRLFRSPSFKVASVWCYCRIWWRKVLLQADGQIGATVPPAVCFKKWTAWDRRLLEVTNYF